MYDIDEEVIDTLATNLSRAKKGEISYDQALDIPFNINRITDDAVAEESIEIKVGVGAIALRKWSVLEIDDLGCVDGSGLIVNA